MPAALTGAGAGRALSAGAGRCGGGRPPQLLLPRDDRKLAGGGGCEEEEEEAVRAAAAAVAAAGRGGDAALRSRRKRPGAGAAARSHAGPGALSLPAPAAPAAPNHGGGEVGTATEPLCLARTVAGGGRGGICPEGCGMGMPFPAGMGMLRGGDGVAVPRRDGDAVPRGAGRSCAQACGTPFVGIASPPTPLLPFCRNTPSDERLPCSVRCCNVMVTGCLAPGDPHPKEESGFSVGCGLDMKS